MSSERKYKVQPAGPLMKEHRVIEKMVSLLENERKTLEKSDVDVCFLKIAVDFFRFYADHCHHGKEEDILFSRLENKEISKEHQEIMEELFADHKKGRKLTKELDQLADKAKEAGTKDRVVNILDELVSLYRQHIQKEDQQFFLPVMDYFDNVEKDAMIDKFFDFDKDLIHKRYSNIVSELEEEKNGEK
ncbi:MAG: hemerythrin domain-containing protein [Candidatus Omnitrophica bacterium]|nr:hemerythrin domain-containing protein [Candidatus Omnitrophota bacterium]MCF7894361.1 hemerythrin domain-containing protein [Candidatus Omnitrophota bacterium]